MFGIDLNSLLQMPDAVIVEETEDPNHTRFIFQPLEKGYGVTIGNSLRRVLISSVPGSSIIGVKFTDVLHEFQSIHGVLEDVTDIILNLKEVRIRTEERKPFKVNLHFKGPHTWTAHDIQRASALLEVANPDHYIATLSKEAEFDVELRIGFGKGYVPAEEQQLIDYPIGMLPVDAIYTPIKNVVYTIEPHRVGQKTDYERLILDVSTDGTISPIDAVKLAAHIIVEHISYFVNFEREEKPTIVTDTSIDGGEEGEHIRLRKILLTPIEELEISVRAYNCLKTNNIKTLGELVSYTESELLRFRNFGRKSLQELTEIVRQMGLEFGMNVDKYIRADSKSSKVYNDF